MTAGVYNAELQLHLDQAERMMAKEKLNNEVIDEMIDRLKKHKSKLTHKEIELDENVYTFVQKPIKTLLAIVNKYSTRFRNDKFIKDSDAYKAILANQAVLASLIVKHTTEKNSLNEILNEYFYHEEYVDSPKASPEEKQRLGEQIRLSNERALERKSNRY